MNRPTNEQKEAMVKRIMFDAKLLAIANDLPLPSPLTTEDEKEIQQILALLPTPEQFEKARKAALHLATFGEVITDKDGNIVNPEIQ